MEIIEPSADIIDIYTLHDGVRLLQKIEWCGRISHRSEDRQTKDSWEPFIRKVVLGHGDWSIVEHVGASVLFVVDRGMSHEIVRHRLASYTQESTRFVNYTKHELEVIKPFGVTALWDIAASSALSAYAEIIAEGQTPQIARSVLPNCLATKMVMTCNLRNWRHFLLMRTTKETHPQLREVCSGLLQDFKARVPLLFEDIEPGAKQAENMRKPH